MDAPSSLAILFPGQGVGDAEAGELVRAERPDLHELAVELVGCDPTTRIAEGTRFAQPAIYCASMASFARLGRPRAAALAGHSLGEIAALAAAGSIDDGDGLRLAAQRGRLMDLATEAAPPGGMVAVGGERERAVELAERTGLALANENSPGQFVLSGADDGLAAAAGMARELGLRAKRLPVAGAFHSPAMQPAVEPFRRLCGSIEFRPPAVPVISATTAAPFGSDPREELVAALISPVRWAAVVEELARSGIGRYLDIGPGRVLAKLVPRILEGVKGEVADDWNPAHA